MEGTYFFIDARVSQGYNIILIHLTDPLYSSPINIISCTNPWTFSRLERIQINMCHKSRNTIKQIMDTNTCNYLSLLEIIAVTHSVWHDPRPFVSIPSIWSKEERVFWVTSFILSFNLSVQYHFSRSPLSYFVLRDFSYLPTKELHHWKVDYWLPSDSIQLVLPFVAEGASFVSYKLSDHSSPPGTCYFCK